MRQGDAQRRPARGMLVVLLVAACTVAPSPATSPGAPSTVPMTPSPSAGPSQTDGSTGSPAPSTSTGTIPTIAPSTTPGSSAGSTAQPTTPPTPMPTPRATATPTPSPAPSGFDPARISVGYVAYATVPGRPLAITHAGDGSKRLFVADQDGRVYIVRSGDTDPDPFLDISDQVSGGSEQGLLGLAFHPDYPADPRVFVDYTDAAGDTVVSSFTVDPGDPDRVDPASEVVILQVDQPYSNHNGGAIAFGPDGYLYIALGDGGSGGDPLDSGQRLDTLLGKVLRIDIDRTSGGREYAIPSSNPFAGDAGRRDEIWLYGLRNPFRFSFDRRTGDLWIGDVGQGAWEEIDVARAGVGGLNFGWRTMEGSHCYSPATGCSTAGLTMPVVEYSHDFGCAVIGGVVYRGSAYPILRGGYVFADTCTGITWAVRASASGPQSLVAVDDGPSGIAGFGESESGELYAADLDGRIWRVTATAR